MFFIKTSTFCWIQSLKIYNLFNISVIQQKNMNITTTTCDKLIKNSQFRWHFSFSFLPYCTFVHFHPPEYLMIHFNQNSQKSSFCEKLTRRESCSFQCPWNNLEWNWLWRKHLKANKLRMRQHCCRWISNIYYERTIKSNIYALRN